jgi:hypothetical protein
MIESTLLILVKKVDRLPIKLKKFIECCWDENGDYGWHCPIKCPFDPDNCDVATLVGGALEHEDIRDIFNVTGHLLELHHPNPNLKRTLGEGNTEVQDTQVLICTKAHEYLHIVSGDPSISRVNGLREI